MSTPYHIPPEVSSEIVSVSMAMRNAESEGKYMASGKHYFRLLDLLYPNCPPLAPVVPIESLAPEAES
jgi:hypothetical protein